MFDPTISTATAVSLLARMNADEISAEEVTRAYIDRAERLNAKLNVFLHRDAEKALAQARSIDAKRKAGERLGPLAGVPIAIKDVLCTQGEPTTCGSRMLRGTRTRAGRRVPHPRP